MCRTLNIAFAITGILLSILVSRGATVANTRAKAWSAPNTAIIYGLHVALPAHVKNFPPERVPLP
jgi:hypothetical protein